MSFMPVFVESLPGRGERDCEEVKSREVVSRPSL